MRGTKWLMLLFSLLLASGVAVAQDATDAPDEPARVRLAQLALDAPDLEAYVDGNRYISQQGDTLIPAGGLSNFQILSAGTYSIALSPEDAGIEGAVVGPEDITLEAGHAYTLAVVGQYADEDMRFLVIDETAAFPNVGEISSRIFVHNLKGAPNIDLSARGETIVSDVAYGEVATAEQAAGPVQDVIYTATGDPDTIIFEGARPEWYNGVTYFIALAGTYPGEVFEDYFPVTAIIYMGAMVSIEGGELAPGDEASGELGVGERASYTLELDEPATVDILLSAQADSPLDAYVRVYDADGNLIAENDELNFLDAARDAGIMGQELDAGTYTVEVGSWNDAFPGGYVLSVAEAD